MKGFNDMNGLNLKNEKIRIKIYYLLRDDFSIFNFCMKNAPPVILKTCTVFSKK